MVEKIGGDSSKSENDEIESVPVSVEANKQDDCSINDEIIQLLLKEPSFDDVVKFPDREKESSEKIIQANTVAGNIIDDAKVAILNSYIAHERNRLKQQRPLFRFIAWFTGIQLCVFNFIIVYTIVVLLAKGHIDVINTLLNLVKYYIGATVVELIAMITYITTVTFSREHIKILKFVFNDDVQKNKKDRK